MKCIKNYYIVVIALTAVVVQKARCSAIIINFIVVVVLIVSVSLLSVMTENGVLSKIIIQFTEINDNVSIIVF